MKKVTPGIPFRRETLRVLATLDFGRVVGGNSGDKCTAEVVLASQDVSPGACYGRIG